MALETVPFIQEKSIIQQQLIIQLGHTSAACLALFYGEQSLWLTGTTKQVVRGHRYHRHAGHELTPNL